MRKLHMVPLKSFPCKDRQKTSTNSDTMWLYHILRVLYVCLSSCFCVYMLSRTAPTWQQFLTSVSNLLVVEVGQAHGGCTWRQHQGDWVSRIANDDSTLCDWKSRLDDLMLQLCTYRPQSIAQLSVWKWASGVVVVCVFMYAWLWACLSGAEWSRSISVSSTDEWFMSPDWSKPFLLHPAMLPPHPSWDGCAVRDDKRQTLDRGGVEKEQGCHQKREFILTDVLSSFIERLIDSRAFVRFLSWVALNASDK